jgi:CO/xanthine dehydrogenase Mo-binding subunit
MNRLAEALGIDAVEIRRRNLLSDDSLLSVGTPLPKGVSIRQVVEACAEKMGQSFDPKPTMPNEHILRGTGFACAYKNVGFSFGAPEQCTARVELHGQAEIERAILHHAGAEVGQGTHTVMAQFMAETLGIAFEKVELVVSDTATTDNSQCIGFSMTLCREMRSKARELALTKWRRKSDR